MAAPSSSRLYLCKQSYHIIGNYRMGGNVPHPKKAGRSDLVVQLADTVLHVARKLRAYSLKNPGVVPLSPLESLVLLHVHRRPGVSPSDLAQELALRSSNTATRSEEHTSELQSLMRISYAVFCLKKKKHKTP